MPIDIRSEPICIATICIFGCSFVGNLVAYAGCGNPLVVLFAVLILGVILFESIHAIGSAANRRADAEHNRFLAYPRQ
jgi:hypothetical protein